MDDDNDKKSEHSGSNRPRPFRCDLSTIFEDMHVTNPVGHSWTSERPAVEDSQDFGGLDCDSDLDFNNSSAAASRRDAAKNADAK